MVVTEGPNGDTHCVVKKTHNILGFHIVGCGKIFPNDTWEEPYDPKKGLSCKVCNKIAHAKWCDGLSADEIRRREVAK